MGRCFWGRVWAVLLLALGAAGLSAWALQGAAKPAWQLAAAGALWLACALWALRAPWGLRPWQRLPGSSLRWDGVQWFFALPGQAEQPVALQLLRDWQWGLLLQLQGQGQEPGSLPRCLWLERAMQPGAWLALRRAVYSRPRLGGDAGRSAPAADSF